MIVAQRRLQRPVAVGLDHRRALDVARVRRVLRPGSAEVGHERLQGGMVWRQANIRVVVSRDREDRRRIVQIRLVKLRVVGAVLAVVVDDVTKVIEEGRELLRSVLLHPMRNDQLRPLVIDPARVTHRMEHKPARLRDRGNRLLPQHRLQVEVVRRLPGWRRQLVPDLLLVRRLRTRQLLRRRPRMATERKPRRPEHKPRTALIHVHADSSRITSPLAPLRARAQARTQSQAPFRQPDLRQRAEL